MVRRGTEGGYSLGTFFLFLFYGRLSLKTTPDVRRYSNSRAIMRLLSVINSSLCTISAARREYIRCDSCMMTTCSSDDSIRRCSSQVDDVFHHHFCHFWPQLPYLTGQAYLGTIGTDDAIGSFKKAPTAVDK